MFSCFNDFMNATQLQNPQDRRLYRLLEIFPGFIAWLTLFFSFLFSFIKPEAVAIFIIAFDVYWLIKVTYLAFYLVDSYKRLKININTNWLSECQKLPDFDKIYHLVILPTYKEELSVILPTFEALSLVNFPKEKMIIVLACEERDFDYAAKIAGDVKKLYADKFGHFFVTFHPQNIQGEIQGKGSNEAWAAIKAKKIIDEKKILYENVIVSTFDVDTCVHPEYFGCLTHHFLKTKDRHHASYQPIPMFFNNFWESPLISRLMGLNTTFWNMMEQGRPERLYTFSSHSMSFKTLLEVGFWERDVVSEDSRIFWQCFLKKEGDYRCVPLLIPVYMDSVSAGNLRKTLVCQYKQQRRWSWGVENVPYVFFKFLKNKKISLNKKIVHGFSLAEGFHSWATNALIIFIFGWFPLLVGGKEFSRTVLAQNLPYVTQILMTLAMVGMIVSASLGFYLVSIEPKIKVSDQKYKFRKFFSLVFLWVFLPITTIFFGSIPALDSQTRLMFGRYMGFWVTKKVRKNVLAQKYV